MKPSIEAICDSLLDESLPAARLHVALDRLVALCSELTDIAPDRSFDAWAGDSFLDSGVAINPRAAAHCVNDYRRSVVFIRALYAAMCDTLARFEERPLRLLYAGCGPYATLLLPLLCRFQPADWQISLLDVHQPSLDGVTQLLDVLEFSAFDISLMQADASQYKAVEPLHLVIAETMQKSLEQEPQFAVTARLAPQLAAGGVFLPECVEVDLYLDGAGQRHRVANLLTLRAADAARRLEGRKETPGPGSPEAVRVGIPGISGLQALAPSLHTRLQVYREHRLEHGDCELTLPRPCPELQPLRSGDIYRISFLPGQYPHFDFVKE